MDCPSYSPPLPWWESWQLHVSSPSSPLLPWKTSTSVKPLLLGSPQRRAARHCFCSPFFILFLLSSCELPTLEFPSPESWTLGLGETQRLASLHAGQRLPQGDRIPTGQASAQAQRRKQELESWRDEVWAQGLTPLS